MVITYQLTLTAFVFRDHVSAVEGSARGSTQLLTETPCTDHGRTDDHLQAASRHDYDDHHG